MTRTMAPPFAVSGLLMALAVGIALSVIAGKVPTSHWHALLVEPSDASMEELLVRYSLLPRLATSLMAGAALGLAGTVLQQVLRNPIASPSTLGIAGGAHLALAASTIWAPGLIAVAGRESVALVGGVGSLALVLALASARGLTPLAVALAGLVVSLYVGAVASLIVVTHADWLISLFVWGSGSLAQHDWSLPQRLLPQLAVSALFLVLLRRPMTLLGLDDRVASSAGISPSAIRLMALAGSVALTAFVTAAIGVIAFVGLAAPAIASAAGARTFGGRMITAPLVGAALLCLADQAAIVGEGVYGDFLPTGALTAAFGAPLLIWLLPRLKADAPSMRPTLGEAGKLVRPVPIFAVLAILLVAALALALFVGQSDAGWQFALGDQLTAVAPWRWPRIVAAAAAGAMLALAGAILQRMTANPLAGPEVMGITSGAAIGLIAVLFTMTGAGRIAQMAGSAVGAGLALALVLAIARKSNYAPERILLVGLAVGALLDTIVGVLMASGDPRAMQLLAWTAGSTYRVDAPIAWATLTAFVLLVPWVVPMRRWLAILPLGTRTAMTLGVDTGTARIALLLLAACLTACGTLIVGPLSFAGLLSPHIARMLGLRGVIAEHAGAALIGALFLVVADWLGRTLLFPWAMPAGLLATVIGGPFLMLLLASRPR